MMTEIDVHMDIDSEVDKKLDILTTLFAKKEKATVVDLEDILAATKGVKDQKLKDKHKPLAAILRAAAKDGLLG